MQRKVDEGPARGRLDGLDLPGAVRRDQELPIGSREILEGSQPLAHRYPFISSSAKFDDGDTGSRQLGRLRISAGGSPMHVTAAARSEQQRQGNHAQSHLSATARADNSSA